MLTWPSSLLAFKLTFLLHGEPLLEDWLFQQQVDESRQHCWVGVAAPQLLLKQQHLLHQVAEQCVLIQEASCITGHLLLEEWQQSSAQLHLNAATERSLTWWFVWNKVLNTVTSSNCWVEDSYAAYPRADARLRFFKYRLYFFLHESGAVGHPHQNLCEIPFRLGVEKETHE